MKVLVTGAAGYIGSHTVLSLIKSGYSVTGLDNFSNSRHRVIDVLNEITGKEILFYSTDLLHYEGLEKIFKENDINCVIHFAAKKSVEESVFKPLDYYNNNITGLVNLLNVMKEANCKRLIYSSSATVYGDENESPLLEDMPLKAACPYGYTKVAAEILLKDLSVSDSDWRIIALRYFNPVGSQGLIGDDPIVPPKNLFPIMSRVALGILPILKLAGDDYPTPDGYCVRDYIHVEDVAEGHIAAMEALNSASFEAINLGTGKGSSVLEVVETYERATGQKIKREIAPRRAGDVAIGYASPQKAKRLLNWESKRNLEEMCASEWAFSEKILKARFNK